MKTTKINHTGDQSCSCTSCTYRSEADQPSLKRIILQGSRIDRLYYGKYIPLRERKLLEKLVRTRGVYDDIRAQLISNSTISLEKKAVLKPHRKISTKKIKATKYTQEITKLVDLVDKGENLESRELSGCCSCCTCSSKYDDHYKYIDKQRLKRAYPGAHRHQYIKDKIGDYKKRAVRFKTKHIKSDPCTCTFKFSGMLKHLSKGTPKVSGYQPVPFADLKPIYDDEINQRLEKSSYLSFLSNENLQQSKTHIKDIMLEGIRKLSETKLKIQEKIELQEKKSLEKLNKLKNNIKSKVKDHKVKKKSSCIMCKCPERNLMFHIKKDSISKFKDDLKRKKIMKDWECEPECVDDLCIPEECYVKLKQRRSRRKRNEGNKIIEDQMIRESAIKPVIKVQSKVAATMPINMAKQKPRLRVQETRDKANTLRFTNEKEQMKSTRMRGIASKNKTRLNSLNLGPINENASPQKIVRIGSSLNFNIEFYKNIAEPNTDLSRLNLQRSPDTRKKSRIKYDHIERITSKKPKSVNRGQRGSQIKFKYVMKNSKTGVDSKLKSKRRKSKSKTSMNASTTTKESFMRTNTYYPQQKVIKLQKRGQKKFQKKQMLLPYECEPNVCVPDICDPYQCIKLINARNIKRREQSVQSECLTSITRSGKTKSNSTLTSMSYPPLKPKFIKSMTSYKSRHMKNKQNKLKNRKRSIKKSIDSENGRQVVRIGSNFSFNLEFYKTKYPHPISSPNIKISSGVNLKTNKRAGNQMVVEDKATTPINKNLYKKAGIGTSLKRCFCTLKIQEKKKTKKKKMVTMGTDAVNDSYSNAIATYDKSTKTKKSRSLKYMECEPFVCIPGACDPYECLDRINRKRLKEVASITQPPETISVSSTTYLKNNLKTIQIQSKPQSKHRKTSAKTKNVASAIKEYSFSGNNKQAVKIGSSFSFDIEFFKTNKSNNKINSKPHVEQKNKMHTGLKKNYRAITTQSNQKDKINKSSMAGHIIKRCFCTLNLQKYRKNQNVKQKIVTTPMFPREYTVNRASTRFNSDLTRLKYLKNSNMLSDSESNSKSLINRHSKFKNSNLSHLQSTQCHESLIIIGKQSQCYSLSHIDDKWESSISFIEERLMSLKRTNVTNLSQYMRQQFCTMNLQLINKHPKAAITNHPGKRIKGFSKGDKSAVKLGSNFSFNISFSKNLSSPKYSSNTELVKPTKYKKVKTTGTKKYYNKNLDRQSQSAANDLAHKGSAAMPVSKRCFCTLKLHKKGKKGMKNNQKQINIPIPKVPNNTVNRGQNTDFKPMKMAHSLKPYECEPNICVPGHCDPYQCLEIMKRRKALSLEPYECEPNICIPGQCDPYKCLEIMKKRQLQKHTKESGIVTRQTKKSASSFTTDNISKGTQKSYRGKIKPKENSVYVSRKTYESEVIQPSRQVVRVGSNFSFNIEFYKDQGSPVTTQHLNATKDIKDNKQSLRERGISSPTDSKPMQHKNTEIDKSPNQIASTMTSSFLKRCFCTAQLGKNSSPFLKRCFCLMKSIKPFTEKNKGARKNKVTHVDKKINTKNVKLKEHRLAPYECEPGICIPGECNPYECLKIMKRRRMKTKSRQSSTAEMKKTRSVSISSHKLITKNAKIQMKQRENVKAIKTRGLSQSSSKHSDRQVVRIGSNFSFNIEFYKNMPSAQLMKLPTKRRNEVIATRSQMSQVVPASKMDRSTEDKHFLKRCFCTLQLQNQYSHEPDEKKPKKTTKQHVKLSNKSVMTKKPKRSVIIPEDFECPPGICIPNQCDPYECERIIKMRRKQQEYREFGMSTMIPKKSTVSSATQSLKKYKQRTQTTGQKIYDTDTNAKFKEVSSTQRVKIGSSFEFNIEFFKNKNNQGLEISKPPKPKQIKLTHQPKDKVNNAKTQMQKQVKFAKTGAKRTKSQSTAINVSPKLKKCFCTLFLKSAKAKPKTDKKKTSNIGTETKKTFVPQTSTLLPYECEPLICIPGECDPVICLERIMKRNKNFGGNTNFSQSKSTASTMTPGKTKFKEKKTQFKSLSKGEILTKDKTGLNKQAVRIGSNFNFNIEFYKDNNASADQPKKIHNQIKDYGSIKKSDFKEKQQKKSFRNAKSQLQKKECDVLTCPKLKNVPKEKKTKAKNSQTFFKKCFCVLKLNKLRNKRKHAATSFDPKIIKPIKQALPPPPNKNIAIQQTLLPYECEPNVCVPGQCNPYECLKRIQARELCMRNKCDKKCYMTQKSQNICTQINNPCADKCIGKRADGYKIKKDQTSVTSSVTTKRTVNEPRYATNLNKQAVRVGSNFSFNVEFYKKTTPTIASTTNERNDRRSTIENVHDKNIITKSALRRSHGSQAKVITSEDKRSDVQHELSRCFCTLQLQKNKQSKNRKKKLNNLSKPPPFPQIFELRRVSVLPNTKMAKKKNTSVRSVSTRINEKYMKENQIPCPCIYGTNKTEMKTILPFKPNKFKDTTSKTFIPEQNKIKMRDETIPGFKLNKKKSKRHLIYNKKMLKDNEPKVGSISNLKGFLCRCAAGFSKKPKSDTKRNKKNNMHNNGETPLCENICFDDVRSSKSDRRPPQKNENQNKKVKKSKSLKLDNKKRHQEKKDIKESNKNKKKINITKVPDADNTGITVSIKQNKNNNGLLCSHCKMKTQKDKNVLPLKVHFDEIKNLNKYLKPVLKQQNGDVNRTESEKCASCNTCVRKINKEELEKGAGDRLIELWNKNQKHLIRIKDIFMQYKNILFNSKEQKVSPLFEMQLNKDDYGILNKDEVIDKVTKLSKSSVNEKIKSTKPHKKSCQCCICLGKKKRTVVPRKVVPKITNLKKPCTCGSFVCSKKLQKMRKEAKAQKYKKRLKPCVCGSPICGRETAAMGALSNRPSNVSCICEIERDKRKQKIRKRKEKKEAKQRAIVMKKRAIEDKIRRKFRLQQDKEMEKRINKKSSDYILAAESLIDIGKLGITACTDILRSVARCTSDPKQAYFTLKSMKEEPEIILRTMKTVVEDSGVVATAKRVRLRCLSMRGIKKIKKKLEQHAVTKFLIHVADKDPKRRLLKTKKKKKLPTRVRERLDFGCSLYMGSLRKRPYLSVYDKYPWFYPHFLALLNVWKQFVDIILFLLAVVVWSPCIFCMEACRAIMCCFFCTG